MICYSATTNFFYHRDWVYKNLPNDCIDITEKEHAQFLKDRAAGLEIKPDANGRPISVERKLSLEEIRNNEIAWATEELRRADSELNKVQDSDPGAVGSVSEWRGYRKALRSWPDKVDLSNNFSRPKAPDAIN